MSNHFLDIDLLLRAFPGSSILTATEVRQLETERRLPGAYSSWRGWNAGLPPPPSLDQVPWSKRPAPMLRGTQ